MVMQTVLGGVARMDAAHVPNLYDRHFAVCASGTLSPRVSVVAAAVFSQPGRRPAKSDQRSRASFRQHVALARFASRRIFVRRYRRFDQRSLHRLVFIDALLGNARLENHRANSCNRLDSARHGRFAIGDHFCGRTDRARGLVSGHDADRVRHFQYARFVSRCRAHARSASRLSYLPCRNPGGDFQTSSSVCSWGWAHRS